jgi:hypothetical protein
MDLLSSSRIPNILTDSELSQVISGEYENISVPLTEWHRSMLENVTGIGIQCLVYMWFKVQPHLESGRSNHFNEINNSTCLAHVSP